MLHAEPAVPLTLHPHSTKKQSIVLVLILGRIEYFKRHIFKNYLSEHFSCNNSKCLEEFKISWGRAIRRDHCDLESILTPPHHLPLPPPGPPSPPWHCTFISPLLPWLTLHSPQPPPPAPLWPPLPSSPSGPCPPPHPHPSTVANHLLHYLSHKIPPKFLTDSKISYKQFFFQIYESYWLKWSTKKQNKHWLKPHKMFCHSKTGHRIAVSWLSILELQQLTYKNLRMGEIMTANDNSQ